METRAARAPAFGRRAMAVTGHSLGSLAGIRVFEQGGNIVDAAIAASAATASVLHHAAGIGGDCFVLYHDATSGRTYGLNASGTAPGLASPGRFSNGIKAHGPLASVVPGLVRGWEALHRRFGKLPWRSLFDAAIDLAEAHPVSQVAATRAATQQNELRYDPGCAGLYLPRGKPIETGAILQQKTLAKSLRLIADQGADVFYRGAIAESIDAFFKERDGLMRASDLAAYEPLWVEPISTDYRGNQVLAMPPNSCGALLLMQLDGLSAIESAVLRSDPLRRMAYQMSAMKAAFADSVRHIADPGAMPNAIAQLSAPAMKAKMREAVLTLASFNPGRDSGGTSCLLLADAEGNAISLVQSIFNVFGANLLDPDTGILFNNRMQGFTHEPGKVNSVAPHKRPRHTLCPVLVLRDGRLRFALATPGGLSQTLTLAQVLSNLVDNEFDVQRAVEFPRWCNTKSGDFLMENEFPAGFVSGLAALGHRAERRDDGYFYGSAKAIELFSSGALAGGADFRREATALGW